MNEIKDRLYRNALTLYGDQQQRRCIARVLALEPEAFLLDESCNALAPISAGIIEQLLNNLKQNYTTLIVKHNLAQGKHLADYVSFMWHFENKGKLIEHHPTYILFNH